MNLQYDSTEADLAALNRYSKNHVITRSDVDPTGDQDDFAALISSLDAVVSVSNSTVHLAGGLGVPTLALLPAHVGLMWYWFREGDRSPWYSQATLARQSRAGDWSAPLDAAARWLEAIVGRAGG